MTDDEDGTWSENHEKADAGDNVDGGLVKSAESADDGGDGGEIDHRHGYKCPPDYKISKMAIIIFFVVKVGLPLLDFYTDLTMMATFGIPAIIGYKICVEPSQSSSEFANAPKWSLDGETCGYIDQRIIDDGDGARRRRLDDSKLKKASGAASKSARYYNEYAFGDAMEFLTQAGANSVSMITDWTSSAVSFVLYPPSQSSSTPPSSVVGEDYTADRDVNAGLAQIESNYQQVHTSISDESEANAQGRFSKRYKGRVLAASDVLTPKTDVTDTCDPETTQASCEAIDECRWDSSASNCFDPILATYNLATAEGAPTITRGEFEKLYCMEFQPWHRGGTTNASTVTINLCRAYTDSDGTKICDWDFAGGFCSTADSFHWWERPDDCYDVQSSGAWSSSSNTTCQDKCHCNYRPKDTSKNEWTLSYQSDGSEWHCIDRRVAEYMNNPVDYNFWKDITDNDYGQWYCDVMTTQSCCEAIDDADGADYCEWDTSALSCSPKTDRRRLKSTLPVYAQGEVLPTPKQADKMAKYLRGQSDRHVDPAVVRASPSPASTLRVGSAFGGRKLQFTPSPGSGYTPSPGSGSTPSPGSGSTPSPGTGYDDDMSSGGDDGGGGGGSFTSSSSSTTYEDCTISQQGDSYCLLGGMSKMYSAQSMEERLCAQCTSCGQHIYANQVQLPAALMLTSTSEAQEAINSFVKTFKQKFQCCNCNLIGSGETCLPTETEWSVGNYTSTCDRISMLPDFTSSTLSSGDMSFEQSTEYEMRLSSVWAESPACLGEPYVSRDKVCVGYFRQSSVSTVYEDDASTCVSVVEYDDTYTVFTAGEETTCKARFITDPNTWMDEEGTASQYCYHSSNWTANSCMNIATLFDLTDFNDEMTDFMESIQTLTDMTEMQNIANDMQALIDKWVLSDQCDAETLLDSGVTEAETCCADKAPSSATCSSYGTQSACEGAGVGCEWYSSGSSCIRPIFDSNSILYSDRASLDITNQQYCQFMMSQSTCEGWTDSKSVAYCTWDSGGSSCDSDTAYRGDVQGSCTNDGTYDCFCSQAYPQFTGGYNSRDAQCPHMGSCYLQPDDECTFNNNGGIAPVYDLVAKTSIPFILRWKPGSIVCTDEGYTTDNKMMLSSAELYAKGCGGYEMPFGCEVESDKVAVGDIVISPEGMLAVCGGDKYDECRTCTLSRVFGWDYFSGEFNYGDSTQESVGTNLSILYIQSIALFWLVMTIIIKEFVGMAILCQQFGVLGGTSPDVDYVTIGKDCGVALVVLLYVFFFKLHDWHERAFYIARFKQLEEGEEEEEEEEAEEEAEEKKSGKGPLSAPEDHAMKIESTHEKDVANKEAGGGLELTAVMIVKEDEEDVIGSEGDGDNDNENKKSELEKVEEELDDEKKNVSFADCIEFLENLTGVDCAGLCGMLGIGVAPPKKEYIVPLIEPLEEDTFYLVFLWDWLELLEGCLGLLFGITFLVGLASATRSSMIPPPGATALAMVSLLSGLVDIMTNILDNFWDPQGKWGKRAKAFLQIAILISALVFIAVIASFPYTQPGCI